MRIQQVEYGVFDSEVDQVESEKNDLCHELDGEVRFTGIDGKRVFASWRMGNGVYGIFLSTESFFKHSGLKSIDVTDTPLWRPILLGPIDMKTHGRNKEVLEISSGKKTVYLCAYEGKNPKNLNGWDIDVVHISTEIPKGFEG